MGFDPLVYEQPLWNTLHGHIAEQSALSYTTSAFGQDLFLFHFVLLPFYALKETTATLLFLQTVGAAFGALAVYLIARDALPRTRIVPLLFARALPLVRADAECQSLRSAAPALRRDRAALRLLVHDARLRRRVLGLHRARDHQPQ